MKKLSTLFLISTSSLFGNPTLASDHVEIPSNVVANTSLCLRPTKEDACQLRLVELNENGILFETWAINSKNEVKIDVFQHTNSDCTPLNLLQNGQQLRIKNRYWLPSKWFVMNISPSNGFGKDVLMTAHAATMHSSCPISEADLFGEDMADGSRPRGTSHDQGDSDQGRGGLIFDQIFPRSAYLKGSDKNYDYYVYLADERLSNKPQSSIKYYIIEIFDKAGSSAECDNERPEHSSSLCRIPRPQNGGIVFDQLQGDAGGGAERPPPGR